MFRILDALNKACYEFGYLRTLPFTEERDSIVDSYLKRKEFISKLKVKLHIGFRKG